MNCNFSVSANIIEQINGQPITSTYYHDGPIGEWLLTLLNNRVTTSILEIEFTNRLSAGYVFEAPAEEIEHIKTIVLAQSIPTLFKRQVLACFSE